MIKREALRREKIQRQVLFVSDNSQTSLESPDGIWFRFDIVFFPANGRIPGNAVHTSNRKRCHFRFFACEREGCLILKDPETSARHYYGSIQDMRFGNIRSAARSTPSFDWKIVFKAQAFKTSAQKQSFFSCPAERDG